MVWYNILIYFDKTFLYVKIDNKKVKENIKQKNKTYKNIKTKD